MPVQNPFNGIANYLPFAGVAIVALVPGSEQNGTLISIDAVTGAYSFQITDTNKFHQFSLDLSDSSGQFIGTKVVTDLQSDPALIAVCESPIMPQVAHEGDILIPFVLEMPDGVKVIEQNTGAFGFTKDQKGQIEVNAALIENQEIVLQVDTERCKAKSCVYKVVKCVSASDDSCCGGSKNKQVCNISINEIKLKESSTGKFKIDALSVSANGAVSYKVDEGLFVSDWKSIGELDASINHVLTIRSQKDPSCKLLFGILPIEVTASEEEEEEVLPTVPTLGINFKAFSHLQSAFTDSAFITTPLLTSVEPRVDIGDILDNSLGGTVLPPVVTPNHNQVAYLFKGFIKAPTTQTLKLLINASFDSTTKLEVGDGMGGVYIINVPQGTINGTVFFDVNAGDFLPIIIKHVSFTGNNKLNLQWQLFPLGATGPANAVEPIPDTNFYH